ncbi:MAG TPA: tetratricopeptide repeat protein [Vicinamibacterales bacterium]|nr:tetratricopeptide repeat protein [Vicinamibacterales bacterium]
MIGTLFLLLALSLPQAGESTLSAARRLINEGQPRKAIEQLESLKAGADAALQMQIDLLLGVAYYHADDPARAVELLAPVVDRLPADSVSRREAEQVLGLSAVVIGRFADAIPRLEATRTWAPDNQELAYALAQAYVQTQRPDSARATVASIYRVPADSAAAHLLAAQLMIRLEIEPQAEVELTKAVEKDARIPGANLLLGQIALFRGRLPEAVSLTQREIAINPGNGMAFSQLGDAYVRQSKWDDAIAALQKSIWLNPYYSAPYILLARAYMKQAQPAVAEGMLRRAIQLDPNNRTAHYQLAQLLQQAGREEEAKREFEIAERLKSPRDR